MRLLFLGLIIVLIIDSCNRPKPSIPLFDEFEFSYTNTFKDSYTIKFTKGDTVYKARYFPYPDSNFIGVITPYERKKLDSLISKIDFGKLDSLYYQTYEDGLGYQFYIKNDSVTKTILVHSESVPDNLKQLAYWITHRNRYWKLSPVDSVLEMKHVGFFKPPIVISPTNKEK